MSVVDLKGKRIGRASEVWQYDYGQKLYICGIELQSDTEVQFSQFKTGGETESRVGSYIDGAINVQIPNELLFLEWQKNDYEIYAFIYVSDEKEGRTEYRITIPVKSRPKPGLVGTDAPVDNLFFKALIEAKDCASSAYTSKTESARYADEAAISQEASAQSADSAKQSENNAATFAKQTESLAELILSDFNEVQNEFNQLKNGLSSVAKSGSYNDLKDKPDELPASDVYEWAKQPQKPNYNANEVGALPDTTEIPSISDVIENTEARHEHNNKTVLDEIDDAHTKKWNDAYSHSASPHAPENAQENIIEEIKVNGSYLSVTKKSVNLSIPAKTSDIENDKGFITNVVDDLVNYYLKSEVYTKEEVQLLIGRISSLELIKVDALPTENIKTNAIYLLPNAQSEESNIYTEYIYMDGKWEIIGDTSVDLSQYALKTEIPTKLSQLQNDSNYSQFSGSYNDLSDKPTIVGDVQANGVSIVNGGIANIPIAGTNVAGIGKAKNDYGVCISDDFFKLTQLQTKDIDSRDGSMNLCAITLGIIDYTIKDSLCHSRTTYTDSDKKSVRTLFGAVSSTDVATMISDALSAIGVAEEGAY